MKRKKKLPQNKKVFFLLRIDLLIIFLGLLLLPPLNYYSSVQAVWEKPSTIAVDFLMPPPAPIVKNLFKFPAPVISAKSAIIIDVPSSAIIFRKDPVISLPQASTTKIMTALIALETYLPDQILSVGEEYHEGQVIDLIKNEKLSVENLLYALLVPSANDAAEVLAANDPNGRAGFIEKMNQKAIVLNLINTHYVNPTGIDEAGQYSSALDLARLSMVAIKNPLFSKIVATNSIAISNEDHTIFHNLYNVNTLLGTNSTFKGIKTGWTDLAGECLVGLAERDGKRIITVVLGSSNRFGETEQLVNWTFNNFAWETVN